MEQCYVLEEEECVVGVQELDSFRVAWTLS
jgi:hypothetical protein